MLAGLGAFTFVTGFPLLPESLLLGAGLAIAAAIVGPRGTRGTVVATASVVALLYGGLAAVLGTATGALGFPNILVAGAAGLAGFLLWRIPGPTPSA